MTSSSDITRDWYDEHADFEDQRLDAARVEYAITLSIIKEVIQGVQEEAKMKSIKIADIGCGTGRYAVQLALEGHRLWISDLSSREIDIARTRAMEAGVAFQASEPFDARHLRNHNGIFKRAFYDVSLFLGPFYHILEEQERIVLMTAALEMVRPGGYVAAAFVTRNAHFRDMAGKDPKRLAAEATFYRQYVKDGQYTRAARAPMHHTTPIEINAFLDAVRDGSQSVGIDFKLVKMVSCEGFLGFQHASQLSALGEDEFHEWLQLLLQTSSDAETWGCADHLLVVLKRLA